MHSLCGIVPDARYATHMKRSSMSLQSPTTTILCGSCYISPSCSSPPNHLPATDAARIRLLDFLNERQTYHTGVSSGIATAVSQVFKYVPAMTVWQAHHASVRLLTELPRLLGKRVVQAFATYGTVIAVREARTCRSSTTYRTACQFKACDLAV